MLLNAENIVKSFGPQPVLRGVSLSLDHGQSLALTGESGSGKSTLIHILGALDIPDAGRVTFDDRDIGALGESARARLRRQDIGLVFQQFNLIPSLTARQNLEFQAKLAKRFDPVWQSRLVEGLGLGAHLSKFPEQLSGGQQQRVAIGRALAAKPKLVLADEPTGNLDEATADTTMQTMLELVRDANAGLIMATHSRTRASALDRTAHLSLGVLA